MSENELNDLIAKEMDQPNIAGSKDDFYSGPLGKPWDPHTSQPIDLNAVDKEVFHAEETTDQGDQGGQGDFVDIADELRKKALPSDYALTTEYPPCEVLSPAKRIAQAAARNAEKK